MTGDHQFFWGVVTGLELSIGAAVAWTEIKLFRAERQRKSGKSPAVESDRVAAIRRIQSAIDTLDQIIDEQRQAMRVHNHPPYRPYCPERRVPGGRLRGACLNDDGSDRG